MAAPTSVPDLLKQIAENSQAQLQLLKDQGHAGKQFQAQFGSAQSLHTITNTISSVLPAGLAQPVANLARTGFHAMQSLGMARQAVSSAGHAVSGAVQKASSAGGSIGSLVSGGAGIAAALGPIALAAAATAGALVTVTAAAVAVPFAIYSWTESLLDSQRQISRFSPELASIFLQMDAAQITRDRTFGRETAGSTGELAESMMAMKDALLPISIAVTNLQNTVGTALLDKLTDLVEGVADLLGLASDLQDNMSGPMAFKAAADELAKAHTTERKRAAQEGRPPFAGRP